MRSLLLLALTFPVAARLAKLDPSKRADAALLFKLEADVAALEGGGDRNLERGTASPTRVRTASPTSSTTAMPLRTSPMACATTAAASSYRTKTRAARATMFGRTRTSRTAPR